ncbi:hypothetical protein IIA16_03115 [bacterium]|nr:hypothetical protein [bacterium]
MADQAPNASRIIAASSSFAIIGTTCCALPAALVAVGAGGAMASLVSAAPWLVALSKYKVWVFLITAVSLAYAWWQYRHAGVCDIAAAKRLRWQRVALGISTSLFGVSLLAAYALLPLAIWWDGRAPAS